MAHEQAQGVATRSPSCPSHRSSSSSSSRHKSTTQPQQQPQAQARPRSTSIPHPQPPKSKPSRASSRLYAPNPPKNHHHHHHQEQQHQQSRGRPLEAAAILGNPRLQQITGLHPHKLAWLQAMQPPRAELERLQWALSLPEPYPKKRPRGNFLSGPV
ncbi:uncharacterized protein GGS25DRAFT_191219 [Hypoxylon fragiforme]|uniref:uncharacterized protein n=1 Tax=Hypoxylon fragiforme TaxID=63214 RepID=UPI0020C6F2A6|nr:uncharacterized protein GGS25DRAFT_191219 [Hypoxylon fragiforme]KAI2611332.1 hypothetical protein GGS25DRAFT_191219 [Hypoxylon fragiforme]